MRKVRNGGCAGRMNCLEIGNCRSVGFLGIVVEKMSRGFIRDFWAHKLSDIIYEPKRMVEIMRLAWDSACKSGAECGFMDFAPEKLQHYGREMFFF